MTVRAPIVLDSDPGIDDAVALQYLLGTGLWDLKAYTSVGGNLPAEATYANARALSRALRIDGDIPVHRGAGRPLSSLPYREASAFHGPAGLGDETLPDSTAPHPTESSAQALLRLSRAYEGELTVCATGPLTNIAVALLEDPHFAHRVARFVFMGGAAQVPGNITPVAEFNIWADPDAAEIVLSSGIPFTMVDLDASHRWLFRPADLAALEAAGPGTALAARLMRTYMDAYTRHGGDGTCPLHDPLAVGVCGDEAFVAAAEGAVVVECASELTRGQTVFVPATARRVYYSESPALTARLRATGRVALGPGTRDFSEDLVATLPLWPAVA
ncbi:nucleoside hydrolase [Streptomyces stelliscabiei]|uniref:nucleoside hydrolase n=1 Tax=Streptomyces stelliscabiei TaxID=146820 RepID=UPI0029AFCA56|nr:nucleoside hydrolase [Streptomyces stelliscabiei]MDX2549256.1 nucleoside hydrolase [Streptomyces stelliscabiei]MDX2611279.1 nucleoside hydrolase [Streptomyces stelliscabiei]MDX2634626.1 nucleoside hydrolase [Streptomyces stelliscabiei]MDX2659572.1 nucleoside hydrolase [Streptomyces stelliscabiei]MDX2711217.1 nucleoside hydrolase [Streptomyces stelliscabiei]